MNLEDIHHFFHNKFVLCEFPTARLCHFFFKTNMISPNSATRNSAILVSVSPKASCRFFVESIGLNRAMGINMKQQRKGKCWRGWFSMIFQEVWVFFVEQFYWGPLIEGACLCESQVWWPEQTNEFIEDIRWPRYRSKTPQYFVISDIPWLLVGISFIIACCTIHDWRDQWHP